MDIWSRKYIHDIKQGVVDCHSYSADGRFHRILLEIEDALDSLDSYLARADVHNVKELAEREEEELLAYGVHAWESLQEKLERTKEMEAAAKNILKPNLKVLSNESLGDDNESRK